MSIKKSKRPINDHSFLIQDKIRDKLARKKKLIRLKETYKTREIINRNTDKFWNSHIEGMHKFKKQSEMTKDRINAAIKFVNKKSGKLLDIGFGHGFIEKKLIKKKENIQLYGIDISKKAITKINKSVKGFFKKGSVLKIPFSANTFDTVMVLEVLEHIQAYNAFLAYKEIKRVLKGDGELIISVPVYENYSEKFNPNRHIRSYTPALFLTELKLAGFRVTKLKRFYAFSKYYKLKNSLKYILKNRWKENILLVSCDINQK